MKIELLMIIGSIAINFYVFVLFFIEICKLLKLYFTKKYVFGDKNHTIEHIEYTTLYLMFLIAFFLWLFLHGGFEHSLEEHLIGEYMFIVLFILGLSGRVLIKHIRKERLQNK